MKNRTLLCILLLDVTISLGQTGTPVSYYYSSCRTLIAGYHQFTIFI